MKPILALRHASGVFALVFLALLVTSGWALMANYVPSDAEAFASVLELRREGGAGAFLRSVHAHGASALVVAAFVFLLASYLGDEHRRRPRAWWAGVGVYFVLLGLCFTGFLLPMDQNAYWGSVVRLGIVETAPALGPPAADLLRGGAVLNASTLPRFYALHASILPCLLAVLLVPLVRPLPWRSPQRARWLVLAAVGAAGLYAFAAWRGAPLELPADSTDSAYVPRPEWYFLWLFQFGKVVEATPWIRSLVLPLFGLGLLVALPWWRQSAKSRAALAGTWCAVWIAFTGLALWQDRDLPPKLEYEPAMRAWAGEGYREHCYDCHAENGRGRGPRARAFDLDVPDLTREETWRDATPDEMRAAIRDGKGKDMPAFRRHFDREQIDALLAYLEATFRPSGE